MTVRKPLVIGPNGAAEQLQVGDTLPLATNAAFGVVRPDGSTITSSGGILSATGGGGGASNQIVFPSIWDAETSTIAGSANAVQVLGYYQAGDAGGAIYPRVSSLPSPYQGDGTVPVTDPPSITSGGLPVLVFQSTFPNKWGTTRRAIKAGDLTVLLLFNSGAVSVSPPPPPLSSFTDTAGNVYNLAVYNVGTTSFSAVALYYCNAQFDVPLGSSFNINVGGANNGNAPIAVFTCPGFIGAVLDVTNSTAIGAGFNSISVSTGALSATPSLVFGVVNPRENIFGSPVSVFEYTSPAGWFPLNAPLINAMCPIDCIITTNAAGVTYTPDWTGTPTGGTGGATAVIAAFKVAPRTVISPSFFILNPTYPIHTTQYGMTPNSPDNSGLINSFNIWLASVIPPSFSSQGGTSTDGNAIQAPSSIWISGAVGEPMVLNFNPPAGTEGPPLANYISLKSGDMISLFPVGIGQLPAPLVAGKRYYVQYGTVNIDGIQTVQISDTSIFLDTITTPKGTPIVVPGGGLVQSGPLFSTYFTSSLGAITPGTGYTPGFYSAVPLTGGSGSGATAEITVGNGTTGTTVTAVTLDTFGNGYVVGDVLSATIPGGSGFSIPVIAVTHGYLTYAESWTDVVLDPGIYFTGANQAPCFGSGLKYWRLHCYGARFQNHVRFFGVAWDDINANTNGSGISYQALFKTTNTSDFGVWPIQIQLLDPSEAANFYVNDWAILKCSELQSSVIANWNNFTFEYNRIKSSHVLPIASGSYNASTHDITLVLPNIDTTLFATELVSIISLNGQTGAAASLIGNWVVSSVTGTGPYTVVLAGPTIAASGFTTGRLATGFITFYENIQYNYRSTLPKFFAQSQGALYSAFTGPATIVQTSGQFDQVAEVRGLNIYGTTELEYAAVVSLKLFDCNIYGWGYKTGPFPTTMQNFEMRNCRVYTAVCEVDKMIDTLYYFDTTFDSGSWLLISSASINKMVFERCRFSGPVANIGGTGKYTLIKDCFLRGQLSIGPTYGVCENLVIIGSTISSTATNNQASTYFQLNPIPAPSFPPTYVDGTLKIPVGCLSHGAGWFGPNSVNSANILRWNVPGGKVVVCAGSGVLTTSNTILDVNGTMAMVQPFTVLDSYVDGSDNMCVDTDLPALPATSIAITGTVSGTALTVSSSVPSDCVLLNGMFIAGAGLPAGATITASGQSVPNGSSPSPVGTYTLSNAPTPGTTSFTASVLMITLPHPAPRMTVQNCTGGQFVSDMAGSPPDIAMWSYYNRAFSGGDINFGAIATKGRTMPLAGYLRYCEIDVYKAYTGSGAGTCTITMFGWKNVSGNYYPTYATQVIDLKTPGVRTITVAGGTGLGTDSFVAVPFFLSGSHSIILSANGGGDTLSKFAAFVVTSRTYQGIEYSGLLTQTVTSGADELADTTMQAVPQ